MVNLPERSQQDIANFVAASPTMPDQLDLLFNFVTNQSNLPYLILDKTFDAVVAKEELDAVSRNELFVRYHSPFIGMDTEGWYATAIYGQGATNPWNIQPTIDQAHLPATSNRWTESADLMPYFKTVLDDILGLENINRCVCFKLMPGGYVDTHTDIPPADGYKLLQVDFNVHWPNKAKWYLEGVPGGVYPTVNGTVAMHSSIAKHCIVNNSDEPRYLVWAFANFNEKFKQLVVDSYLRQHFYANTNEIS
jgi:hypothetical protein